MGVFVLLRLKKYRKSPYWQVRGTVAGKLIHRSTGTADRTDAEEFRRKLERETYDYFALGKERPVTFSEAAIVYINRGGEKKTLKRLVRYFKDKTLNEIGQIEIDEAAKILFPGCKASTINRSLISPYITIRRAAINAEMRGTELRSIKRRKEVKPIVKPATDEHIAKLLPHCSHGLVRLLEMMTFTGFRTGEALKVKREDCIEGYIHVGHTKNGEPRMVPIPDGWEFPARGFGYGTTQGVGRALRKAHHQAGLEYYRGHQIGRHGFAARWLKNGNSIKSLKEAGNWKTLKIVDQTYGHLEQTSIHDTMRELSRKK